MEEAEMPPLEFVMEFAKGLREAMSLGFLIFFGYIIHVQNLCKWRETKSLFILFLLHFYFIFCFERRGT